MATIEVHAVADWFKQFRARGETASRAVYLARIHQEAETAVARVLAPLSPASRARVDSFVDCFIRSEQVSGITSDNNSDFINEPDRAARIASAPEGCGCETHGEVIEDWREALRGWHREKRRSSWGARGDRFEAAVSAHFDAVELWHEFNGSLNQERG
jgi:hypothetical protein